MVRLRMVARLLLTLAMLAVAVGGGNVAAQSLDEEGAVVSELTGLEITFSADWEVAQAEVSPDGENELIFLESSAGLLMIGFGSTDDVEASIASTIADFDDAETIDGAVEADFAWELASSQQDDGSELLIYVEAENAFTEDYQLVAGLIVSGDLVSEFELVQDTVSIDDGYVFVGHDADELEALLGESSARVDDEPSPETEGNVTETGEAGRETESQADAGSHEFELVDLVVEVSDPVEINQVQVEEGTYEQILLVGGGAIGAVSVLEGGLSVESTLEGFMSGFLSEMGNAEEIDSGDDGDTAWTLYSVDFQGSDWYVYATADGSRFGDLHYLELIMAPTEDFEEEFVQFQDSVDVDGDGMFAETDINDLLDLIDAAP